MEIKVLGICGSPIKNGNTEALLRKNLEAAEEAGNVKTTLITLAGKTINDCNHCNWCVKKQKRGKFCSQKDDMTGIYAQMLETDAVVFASPAYIGRMSGYMACMLDRLRAFIFGNVYSEVMRNKIGGALVVAWGRNQGVETTLLSLMSAIFIMEMIPVGPLHGPGSIFGAAGMSSENGTGRFNRADKLGVLKDEYGVKGAQDLGKRVVEITRLVKAGNAALL